MEPKGKPSEFPEGESSRKSITCSMAEHGPRRVGRPFGITATLEDVPLCCDWIFLIKRGATQRFSERFVRAIEAGLVVGDIDRRVDVFGDSYFQLGADRDWLGWPRGSLSRWMHRLEEAFGERGNFPGSRPANSTR